MMTAMTQVPVPTTDPTVCMTESVIRRYTLTELTAWVDMPMPERYGCIDIDERRVIPDIEIREAVIKACGLRSIADSNF